MRRRGRSILTVFSLLLILWSVWSCKDTIAGGGASNIVFPDSNISYGKYVQPLFLDACAIPQCHTTDFKAGGLSLETYAELMETPGVVWRGNPDASSLVKSIEGSIQPRMPIDLPPLTSNQIKGIRQWILEGAQDN